MPKKKTSKSPTQRSLALLRENKDCIAQVVEHWNAFSRKRVDLFGIIDIVSIGDGKITGVQTTTGGSLPARIKKAMSPEIFPKVVKWLQSGGAFHLHGWRKLGGKWIPRIVLAVLLKNSVKFVEKR